MKGEIQMKKRQNKSLLMIVVSILLGIVIYIITKHIELSLLFFAFTLFVFLIIQYLINILSFKNINMRKIDQMSDDEFKVYLSKVFKRSGYRVKRVDKKELFGADFILHNPRNNRIITVLTHKSNAKVKIEAVQKVVASVKHYGADEAWVVSNSFFSDSAKKLANSNGVMLIDRKGMLVLTKNFDKELSGN